MRVGFTGHQNLPPEFVSEIERSVRRELEQDSSSLTGLSSLADGADQMFASAVLTLGGRLEAVIPSDGYETTFSGLALDRFRHLLSNAARIHRLPFDEPGEEAFFAAGRYVVNNSDRIIAVWDGGKAVGLGGTGDVVKYAQDCGVDVTIIWPKGATRS